MLGSGSGGNCAVVGCGERAILIDAGLGPRVLQRRLGSADLSAIASVCLTHLDRDHFRPSWVRALLQHRIQLHVHRWHANDLFALPGALRLEQSGLVHLYEEEPFAPLSDLTVSPVRLSHDIKGTSGFRIEGFGGRIGYATDLGYVPALLIRHFTDVAVLALESNYDPHLQRSSGRPIFLQRRITGRAGHLSNQQAFDAVRQIVSRSRAGMPKHIVLLHRSIQCNRRYLVRQMFKQDPHIAERIILAEQRQRTAWLSADCGERFTGAQLCLAFG